MHAYPKQGSSSLVRLGFTAYQEAGISRRPKLLNAAETCAYLLNLALTLPNNPPFHTEVAMPNLPANIVQRPSPGLPEIHIHKREQFLQHVRYALIRKKQFDRISHPGPN